MIRLVLDTNVLVSGLLKPGGAEGRIIDMIVAGAAQFCMSDPILEEYREVLLRPKFGFNSHRVESLLRELKRVGVHTDPPVRLSVSRDEADNRFLECAEAAAAVCFVTGNKRHFPPRWANTEIVNARELIRILAVS